MLVLQRITEEQRQRQDLEVKYVLCEQENTQLRKELMTTPYVTNGPQTDQMDQIPEEPAMDTSDISTGKTGEDHCYTTVCTQITQIVVMLTEMLVGYQYLIL